MCIAAVLFSLIPILSGYAVYLAFATVVTRGSPAVQWTFGLLLAAALLGAFLWAVQRGRRRHRARTEGAARPGKSPDRDDDWKPAA